MQDLTLTVPYAGVDRIITGPATAIARAAAIIAAGLPTLADMNLTPELCDESLDKGRSSMGMGNGGGREFIQGSHTLLMAIQRAMLQAKPAQPGDDAKRELDALLADTVGDHTRARIARLARANGIATLADVAKLEGGERMSMEGRILEVLEDRVEISHSGPLAARVTMLEGILGTPAA